MLIGITTVVVQHRPNIFAIKSEW